MSWPEADIKAACISQRHHDFLALAHATCLSPLYHEVNVTSAKTCRYVYVYCVVFFFPFELENMYLLHI